MSLTKEQAKYRKPRRTTSELYNAAKEYQDYVQVCNAIGVPVLLPSPIQLIEQERRTKRKRRTNAQIEKDKQNARFAKGSN